MDNAVRAVRDDHDIGMAPVRPGSELALRVWRLESEDQLVGSVPVAAMLATSRVTRVVMEDQDDGRLPVTEVVPLVLRYVNKDKVDQASGRLPVRAGLLLTSKLTKLVNIEKS